MIIGGLMETVETFSLVGGHVDEELLVRNEYQAAENRILKAKLPKPVQFNLTLMDRKNACKPPRMTLESGLTAILLFSPHVLRPDDQNHVVLAIQHGL
jgi:hypothetical protein